MDKLVVTSCLAANTHAAGRAVTAYIGRRLGVATVFDVDIRWQERERLLDRGQIHLGWICGLLYVVKAARPDPQLALLAAPVMRHPRYRGQPIYHSESLVRHDSPFHSFDDLKGARWVYNEPGSYSGYVVVCNHLVKRGESLDYFGSVLKSGSHLNSLQMVLDGRADFTALDSTVLDYVSMRWPGLARKLRVVETLGPSPIPPWVVSVGLPQDLRRRLDQLLLTMHLDPEGRRALTVGDISQFVGVSDSDYQAIRDVAREAQPVALAG